MKPALHDVKSQAEAAMQFQTDSGILLRDGTVANRANTSSALNKILAGGGFHRYSVDEFWHIPHFEKVCMSDTVVNDA